MTLFSALTLPVVQCPIGANADGMLLGVQVVAAPSNDRLLIDIARNLENGLGG